MTAKHGKVTANIFQQHGLKTAIKKWGEPAEEAGMKELQQSHDRVSWTPIHWNKLTPEERRRAIESSINVKQKQTGELKGRNCADGGPMRATTKPEDTASPTAFLESIILMSVTDAHKKEML